MDPISQGICGTLAAQTISKKNDFKFASMVGWLGGMAADLDVLIRSNQDPLLFLEYHRHFTHSLFFIPIGGLIVSLFLWFFLKARFEKKHQTFKTLWVYTTIGYGTHALLDACTSYGTYLLWPLSSHRFAFDIIGIIDLFFTIPLIILGLITFFTKKRIFTIIAIIFSMSYLSFGFYQRNQAIEIISHLAKNNHHQVIQIEAKPTIGNLWLWRGIYETTDQYYANAIFIPLIGKTKIYPGKSSQKITEINDFFPSLKEDDKQYQDILRFKKFSKNYLSLHPDYPNVIGDFRYALLPQSNIPLWGIHIDSQNMEKHVDYVTFRKVENDRLEIFLKMLKGEDI